MRDMVVKVDLNVVNLDLNDITIFEGTMNDTTHVVTSDYFNWLSRFR